jgi:hypothetical protein
MIFCSMKIKINYTKSGIKNQITNFAYTIYYLAFYTHLSMSN